MTFISKIEGVTILGYKDERGKKSKERGREERKKKIKKKYIE